MQMKALDMCDLYVRFNVLLVIRILNHEPMVRPLQVRNADFDVLVHPQPGVIDLAQGGCLFG